MGEGVDSGGGEGGAGLFQFDVEEEEVGFIVGVVGKERGGNQAEFVFQSGERELGVGMELVSVEEDDEMEGPGPRERQDALEQGVVQADHAGGGLRLEAGKLGLRRVGEGVVCQEY